MNVSLQKVLQPNKHIQADPKSVGFDWSYRCARFLPSGPSIGAGGLM